MSIKQMNLYALIFISILSLSACGGDSDSDDDSPTTATSQFLPTANAGEDQRLALDTTVTLDGSSSHVSSGTLSYDWSFTSMPSESTAILSDATSVSPSFLADKPGEYVISLIVTTGDNTSIFDPVSITAGTLVTGVLSSDTTWDIASSPYFISESVQIAYGKTLTVNPGVELLGAIYDFDTGSPIPSKIEAFGDFKAAGTEANRIVFSDVEIIAQNTDGVEFGTVNIDYAELDNSKIRGEYGSLTLQNSILSKMELMYISYPFEDVIIDKNIFIDSNGISVGHNDDVKVYIRNNVFYYSRSDIGGDFSIQNWAAYLTSETIVEYNSFLNTDRIALRLPSDYGDTRLSGENNYWNTVDTSIIDTMIFDKNDDLHSSDYISYASFLTEPHADTPDATPYINPTFYHTYKVDGLGEGVCIEHAYDDSDFASGVVENLGYSSGTCLDALDTSIFAYCEIQTDSNFDWVQQVYYFEVSISASDAQSMCSTWGGTYSDV